MPPRTPDVKKWEIYLERKLKKKEKILIENAMDEYLMNKSIKNILNKFKNENISIPKLSVTDGNCLFDSLNYHLNNNELRKLIANFMRIYKNYNGIFKSNEFSLYDMFTFQNEIEYLKDKNTNNTYKYTFDIMCSDLECENSWKRLPTEIILLCVSYIFDIKINIYHDNGHKTEILSVDEFKKEIYLGLIDESHYIPLDVNLNYDKINLYDECTKIYKDWVTMISQLTN